MIQYDRPDQAGPKQSTYYVTEINNPEDLKVCVVKHAFVEHLQTGFHLGMDTSKNETVWHGIVTNEMVQYFKGTVKGTLLHCYLINFVVNSTV